jgi:hypothetical protein
MIEIRNKAFVTVLGVILVLNILVAVFMLLTAQSLLVLPGLILSGLILVLMYMKDEYLVLCIKFWAALLCLGGLAGLVGACSAYLHTSVGGTDRGPEEFGLSRILISLLFLGLGLYYFIFSGRYIVKQKQDPANDSAGAQ